MNLESDSLWDSDLIISRDPSKVFPIDFSKKGPFRLYYDHEKGIVYGKISKNDSNYNSIKMEAKRNEVATEEIGDELFIKIGITAPIRDAGKPRGHDISFIPGVIRDPFSLWVNGREFFRYRFIEESSNEVSKLLFKALDFLDDAGENYWRIEYLGPHMKDIDYLKKYQYPRNVAEVTAREIDNVKKIDFFPHYSSPHILYFVLGENNNEYERAIRFSEGLTKEGGIIKESKLLRDGALKIYEDKRNITSFSVSSLSREPFASFPLQFYQLYDGNDALLNWWVDEDDIEFLLRRIKNFNELNKNNVELIIRKIMHIL